MKATQELSYGAKDKQNDQQDQPNEDINSFMGTSNQIKVTLERKNEKEVSNKIKGSKIIAKNQNSKKAIPLAVKSKGHNIANHHPLIPTNSEEDASREVASTNDSAKATHPHPVPVYSNGGPNAPCKVVLVESHTPGDYHLKGALEVKKMQDANTGVFTTSMPAQVDIKVDSNA